MAVTSPVLPMRRQWQWTGLVATPVDDVANALPIGMDWAGGHVDANVANPFWQCRQCVANRNGLGWWPRRRQCRQPHWRCRQCVANGNGLGWWMRRCQCRQPRWRCRQCVANRNGLGWWPRRRQCRQPRWRCRQCVTNSNGPGWWPPLLTTSPMRRQ